MGILGLDHDVEQVVGLLDKHLRASELGIGGALNATLASQVAHDGTTLGEFHITVFKERKLAEGQAAARLQLAEVGVSIGLNLNSAGLGNNESSVGTSSDSPKRKTRVI